MYLRSMLDNQARELSYSGYNWLSESLNEIMQPSQNWTCDGIIRRTVSSVLKEWFPTQYRESTRVCPEWAGSVWRDNEGFSSPQEENESPLGAGNFRNKLNNKGTGGHSKVRRDPLPPLVPISEVRSAGQLGIESLGDDDFPHLGEAPNQDDSLVPSHLHEEYLNGVKDLFMHSAQPPVQTSFDGCGIANTEEYDCLGAPYCGLVCIDIACGKRPDVVEYDRLAGHSLTPWDVVGTPEFLGEYGAKRGVNVAIYRDGMGGPLLLHRYQNCSVYKWVILYYKGGFWERVGHWVLRIGTSSSGNNFNLSEVTLPAEPSLWWKPLALGLGVSIVLFPHFFVPAAVFHYVTTMHCHFLFHTLVNEIGWCVAATGITGRVDFVVSDKLVERSNEDVRNLIDRRDPIVAQDSYRIIKKRMVVDLALYEFDLPKWFFGYDKLVSEVRFAQANAEAQVLAGQGQDPNLALASVGRMREVNTSVNRFGVLKNTMDVLRDVNHYYTRDTESMTNTIGLVAMNSNGNNAVVANIEQIANLQAAGKFEHNLGMMPTVNCVLKYNLDQAKVNRKVAVAPIGCASTCNGPLFPGLLSVNDSPSLLSAFCGRSMNKVGCENEELLAEFFEFSGSFLDKLISDTDFSGMVEPDCCEHYASHFRGVKTARDIEFAINKYKDYHIGRLTPAEEKRYLENSAFVKFESNVKESNGKYGVKPRLIMTMNDDMAMELCPLSLLFDRWNDGPFRKFQVKHMTPHEMIDKIIRATEKPHSVTDYSSFEASISYRYRLLEERAFERMCERAGFTKVLRSLRKYSKAMDGRVLSSKWGKFYIQSRCSGDPWTSTGNGIINVCIAAFVAHKKNLPLEIIAEGDDGVIPIELNDPGIVSQLGFKLSSDLYGTIPGDNDFLRSRWVDGKRFLSIGRCMNFFWVKKGANLRVGKQKFLLKCMAYSLHHLSPGHPVLYSMVNRILRNCHRAQEFKGYTKYLNMWKNCDYKTPFAFPVKVDCTMREIIAKGGNGFPPISVAEQLELERRLNFDQEFYIGRMLDDYDDVKNNTESSPNSVNLKTDQDDMLRLCEALSNPAQVLVRYRPGDKDAILNLYDTLDTSDFKVRNRRDNKGDFDRLSILTR